MRIASVLDVGWTLCFDVNMYSINFACDLEAFTLHIRTLLDIYSTLPMSHLSLQPLCYGLFVVVDCGDFLDAPVHFTDRHRAILQMRKEWVSRR